MPSTPEVLAREVGRALLALRGVFGHRQRTGDLLDVLGWEAPPAGPPPFGPLPLDALLAALDAVGEATAQAQVGGDGAQLTLDARYAELAVALAGALGDLRALPGALAGLPGDYLAKTNIVAEFVPRLLAYVVVEHLRENHPGLLALLTLTGLASADVVAADPVVFRTEHVRYALRFDRLLGLLTDPAAVFTDLYGWGTPAAVIGDLAVAVSLVLGSLGLPAVRGALDARAEAGLLGRPVPEAAADPLPSVVVDVAAGLKVLLAALRPSTPGGADGGVVIGALGAAVTVPVSPQVRLEVRGTSPSGAALLARPGQPTRLVSDLTGSAPGAGAGELALVLHAGRVGGQRIPLVGLPGGSGLTAAELTVAVGARGGALFVEVGTVGGQWRLDLAGAGGLLAAILPADLGHADLDLGVGWSGGTFSVRGSAGLQGTFPVHLSVGPVELQTVTVGLAPGGSALPVEVTSTVAAQLGPLSLLVDRIGLTAAFGFRSGGDGNLGPLQVDLGFRPPVGIGLGLDAGPIQGGGYLAVDGTRYSGVLQVKLSFLAVTAFGIVEALPGGGVSFVAVLGIRFWPGIQLGFGFAITGVGGLVGMNRRADVDLLRERLATGAAGNVLFCDDPVANAPTLLGDLAAFFPPAPGSFIVGPTLQIGWLAPIVRLDVAVLIELPGPSKIIILGSVKVLIGANETFALLYLRMDFLGVLDFEQRLLSLDAYLVNSHALGVFRLTGGMAFRLSYGDNPYVLLSIGGFHPRFDPGPLNLPALPRVGAVLQSGLVAQIYLRLEMYVAFTSNTLQLGAKVEAGMELGPLSAHGYLQFDALIQFRPFSFDIEFSAGFSVEVFDVSLCSVDVRGRLTGPGPLVVHAEASVKLLFVRVRGSATVELGGRDGDAPQPVPSLVRAMEPELSRVENLRTEGSDPGVVLRPGPPVDGVLVSPLGRLIWEQKRVPLETLVDRFEGAPLVGPHELELLTVGGWSSTDERDWFSPGTFTALDLKSSQTMNNASFQELKSGIRVGAGGDRTAPGPVSYTPTIDLLKRPDRTRFADRLVSSYLTGALAEMLAERDATPAVRPGPPKVVVAAETHDLMSGTGTTVTSTTPFQAFQLSRLEPGAIAVPTSDAVLVDL